MVRLTWKGRQAFEILKEESANGLRAAAFVVQRQAQTTLNRQGQGRVYKKRGGRLHRASLPGQPPAKDTGNLGRSVVVATAVKVEPRRVTARVGTDQDYGRFLEIGTRHTAPRPWLLPSLNQSRQKALQEIDKRLRRALTRARSLFR